MTHCYYISNIIDKFIDAMGRNGYFLIFIMMKINLKIENYRKKTKERLLPLKGFGWIITDIPGTKFMAARLVRGAA